MFSGKPKKSKIKKRGFLNNDSKEESPSFGGSFSYDHFIISKSNEYSNRITV